MRMSSLIDQSKEKQKYSGFSFIDRLKGLVHEQLKKKTIIFTMTNQNTKFHYYTILDPQKTQIIELYWVIDFFPNLISINVTYSTYRTLGVPIIINDLRTGIQVNFSLKLINKNIPFFLTFILNEKKEICINFQRSIFHQSDRTFLIKSMKSIINQIFDSSRQEFQILHPYLTIPIQMYTRPVNKEKQINETEQFNLIKLKNTFDRFRKNKQRTAELIYQEKDILKMRKKIQQCTKLLGLDLRAMENMRFTTKQIQRNKLLEQIGNGSQILQSPKVDNRIAYQFQIIKVEGSEKKYQVNANSEIYFGKYSYRIFKTLVEDDKVSKSQNFKNIGPIFQQKDVIEERVSCLVKKKAMNKISQKALKNQTSFLKFMRNQICLYIANYYLPLDNSWNELYLEKYDSSLLSFMNPNKIISFYTRLDMMIKVLLGLKFMSDSSICHRDIKPSNIMINKLNVPKIIDFGSTISMFNQKVIMSCNEMLCGTEGYYFPYNDCDQKIKKMFSQKQYESHPLFDIYSYAVIAEQVFEEELKDKFNNYTIKDTLTFVIQRSKQHNPDNRLSYDQVLCLLVVLQKTLKSQQKNEKSTAL